MTTIIILYLEQTLIAKSQGKSIDLGFFPALKNATITMAGTKSTAYAVTVTQSSTVLENLTVDGTTNIFLFQVHLN